MEEFTIIEYVSYSYGIKINASSQKEALEIYENGDYDNDDIISIDRQVTCYEVQQLEKEFLK